MLSSNRRFARASRAAVAGLAVLVVAGCSDPPRACTEIGATNGVNVTVHGLGIPDGLRQVFVEACVAGTCGSQQLLGEESVFVDLATVSSTHPVVVTVTVRQDDGSVLVPTTTATATPRTVQPNGPECDPTAHQAQVTVTAPNELFTPSATTPS